MKVCPRCNTLLDDDALFCIKCRAEMPSGIIPGEDEAEVSSNEMRCPSCDIIFIDGSLFCNKCGTKLEPVPVSDPVLLYKQCPACDRKFEDESLFCNMCGTKLIDVYDRDVQDSAGVMFCSKCKTVYDDDSIFCIECGQRLEPAARSSESSSKPSRQYEFDFDNYSYHCKTCGCSIEYRLMRCSRCNAALDESNIMRIKI